MDKKTKEIPADVNRFKIIGDLVSVDGDKAIVETKMTSMATGRVFTDPYPIEVGPEVAAKLAGLEGTTVGVIGFVDHPAGTANSHLSALDAKPIPNGTHFNRLQLTGPVYQADIMSKKADKKAMGNVSFVIASRVLNAVTWRGAVSELKNEGVRQNAVITLKGRARLREYESQGNLMQTIELTCDQSQDVTVHYVPPMVDEFTFDETEAPAKCEAAPAEAKVQSGRKKSRSAV